MGNEIDRLEIVVEAEASKANRNLAKMEKRITNIANALDKLGALSGALGNVGNVDFGEYEKASKNIDELLGKSKKSHNTDATPRINKADIKYAAKTAEELQKKFKDVGKNIDFSGMNSTELRKQIKSMESALDRMYGNQEKRQAIEGEKIPGKSWVSQQYDIAKVSNQLEIAREALKKYNSEAAKMNKFTIDRNNFVSSLEDVPKVSKINPSSMNYDPDAMRMVFGEGSEEIRNFNDLMRRFGGTAQSAGNAINDFEGSMDSAKINTYEAQIKRLKNELADLANQGYTQHDPEYDAIARELQEVTYAKRNYEKELRSSIKAENDSNASTKNTAVGLKTLKGVLANVSKIFSTIGNGAKKAAKGIKFFVNGCRTLIKGLAAPIATLKKFKNALLGVQKQSGRKFGVPQMIGMSILYSTVFGMISGIKQAIADGTNNLVQYSSEYNKSISSIVSALLYLKNAWAAAFAPIVNVVGPYIQSFINMIASALNAVGKFMAALTGKGFVVQAKKVLQDYGASLDKTSGGLDDANKSAKELQRTILGFDELNVLNAPNNDSGNSGSGGGDGIELSPSDMFETVPVTGAVADFAKRLREAFLKEDWEGLGDLIAEGLNKGLRKIYDAINWNNVGSQITKFADGFTRTFNRVIENRGLWDTLGRTIGTGINTAVKTANLFIGDGGINFKAIGTGISTGLRGAINEIPWTELGNLLGNWFMVPWKILNGFVTDMSRKNDLGLTGWAELGKGLGRALKGVFEKIDFDTIADTFVKGFNGIFEVLKNFNAEKPFEGLGKKISDGLNKIIRGIDPGEAGKAISDFVTGVLGVLVDVAEQTDWEMFGRKLGELLSNIDWKTILGQVFTIISEVLGGLIEGLSQTTGGKVALFMAGLAVAFKGASVLASIGEFVGKVKTGYGALGSIFGKTASSAASSASGVGAAASTAGGSIDLFGGKITGLGGKFLTSVAFTEAFRMGIQTLNDTAKSSDYTALLNSLSLLKEEGSITNDQFNDLYKTLSNAELQRVPFTDAMVYVRDELDKAGVSSEDFEAKLSQSLDKLGTEAPKKAKIIGTGIGDGTKEGLEQSRSKVENATLGLVDKIKKAFTGELEMHSPSKVFFSYGVNTVAGFNDGFTSKSSSAEQNVRSLGENIKKSMSGTLKGLSEDTSEAISGIRDKFRQAEGNASSSASSILRSFSNLHIPLPHLSVSFSSLKVGNTSIPIPSFRVNWYAKGGFPNTGELFVANEKGPEMLGKMGNKNTVANNRQITDGIAAAVGPAVYNAVTSALSSSGNGQGGDLYLTLEIGGEKLVKKIVKDYNNMKQSDPKFGFIS
nr:MAG TPA: minor tail protein [Caudoviricetes sp.]